MNAGKPEADRVILLRQAMRRKRIEALLVTQRENIRYLCGFTGSAGSLVIRERTRPFLITDFRYQEQARAETSGVAILIQTQDHATAIREAAAKCGADRLWFDESSLSMERVKSLRRLGVRMTGIGDPVADLREQKDAREIASIRKAVRRAEAAFLDLRRSIRPGRTERELGLRLEWLMREQGARKAAFDTIVASGRNGALPHASVTNRRLRSGDLVTFDFGAEADGYFCDMTRTVSVGTPSPRQREVHAIVLQAQKAAFGAIAVQAHCRAVDAAARGVIAAAGFADRFGHATGHGIGLMVHERPSLSKLSKSRLQAGMVVTVEPGVYLPGWGGVRIEDMVLVTDRGPVVLTHLPRDLER